MLVPQFVNLVQDLLLGVLTAALSSTTGGSKAAISALTFTHILLRVFLALSPQ